MPLGLLTGTGGMRRALTAAGLTVAIVALGAALRLACLANRPMHADEAVQAVKLGRLLEGGGYVYDPTEYHGPALNYLTLPVARLAGARTLADVSEVHLRLLPALFGVLLVGGAFLLRDALGRAAAACAAALTAVSPAMVFYSRYYIAEMLLVCFSFGAVLAFWRWLQATGAARNAERGNPRLAGVGWLVFAGACLGLMHATKETSAIAMFAVMAAGTCVAAWAPQDARTRRKYLLLAAGVVLASAGAVSVTLFSSFFTNARGPLDSLGTYFSYFGRAAGRGDASWHLHPCNYYLHMLLWWHRPGGAVWTEALIVVLSVFGAAMAVAGGRLSGANRPFIRGVVIYTAVMGATYSAVAYKTPWCMIGFLHGMILLAGVGAVGLVRAAPGRAGRAAVVAVLAAAFAHLAWQGGRASFVAYEDPTNPYAYAQTTSDVPALARRIHAIAAAQPDGRDMHVQVACPASDYWPLPWYLRDLGRVGWHDRLPSGPIAPLIVLKPELEPALIEALGGRALYVDAMPELFAQQRDVQLRPGVPLRPYVRADAWERYAAAAAREPTE